MWVSEIRQRRVLMVFWGEGILARFMTVYINIYVYKGKGCWCWEEDEKVEVEELETSCRIINYRSITAGF